MVVISMIGIHEGVDCLFLRKGKSNSTPLIQDGSLQLGLAQKAVGMMRVSWTREPSARTQERPCHRPKVQC